MRADVFLSNTLGQIVREPLDQPTGIDEHQGRTMRLRKLDDAVVNLIPHLIAGNRAEQGCRNLNREIELALVTDIDDDWIRASVSCEKMRNVFNRLLRRRKTDADRRPMRQRLKPLERKREMRAALVIGYGVNFINDYGLNISQDGPALFRREEDVERLRRGNEDVRWAFEHGPALVHKRVTGRDGSANLRHEQAALSRHLKNFAERGFEVLLNVVAEGLERRDVEDFCPVLQISGQRLADQAVNAGKKCGQSLAGTGGGRN